mmetsp:Transcript_37034/g.54396  ORF Transcript_37034/g.54396 Transcript_37034/m.54396 type:complete len:223 (-) Transcript_37034:663-1331(-)
MTISVIHLKMNSTIIRSVTPQRMKFSLSCSTQMPQLLLQKFVTCALQHMQTQKKYLTSVKSQKRASNSITNIILVAHTSFNPYQNGGCDLNAAFCCWVQDRQASDNNGNCKTPYKSECIDKDPSDNANVCYVDHKKSSLSNHVAGGVSIFGDPTISSKRRGEAIKGPIHCHGFGWAEDEIDANSVYKGNNLFFISMYDHMHQRGYVRNIPGSPMCACAENIS